VSCDEEAFDVTLRISLLHHSSNRLLGSPAPLLQLMMTTCTTEAWAAMPQEDSFDLLIDRLISLLELMLMNVLPWHDGGLKRNRFHGTSTRMAR
jgi:hypothetical protein